MDVYTTLAGAAQPTFGDLLKQLRRQAYMTQRDLALATGYSVGQICRFEQNQRVPDLPTLTARFVPALAQYTDAATSERLLALARTARAARQGRQRPAHPASMPHLEHRAEYASDSALPNLPIPATPLLGRANELARARALMQQAEVRLLTLTGAPGIGKTRLGLQVAAELYAAFADGVIFVALAPISDPSLVVTTIAQALGIQERAGQTLLDRLKGFLREKHMLLLLDNFEHVLAAAPLVATLLAAAPGLVVLATSRAPLRLYGEHELVVPPLGLPAVDPLSPLEEIVQSPAVGLFIVRGQAVRADFALTNANAAAVAEICQRLDGLPLAIELAATRVKLFSPQALLPRLERRLQFLTAGARDLPARQQTLRNTIDWSYDLLDSVEQAIFARMSVFVGGCTLTAAEAVLSDDSRSDAEISVFIPPEAILDDLSSLVDNSLLTQIDGVDDEPRFTMLETIREYALERLSERGEATLLHRRHAAYYLALAEDADPKLHSAEQSMWFDRLEAEHENLRAALVWHDEATDDVTLRLRLAGALWWFWFMHGFGNEGLDRLKSLLSQDRSGQPTTWRAKALNATGWLSLYYADEATAEERYRESLAISTALKDTLNRAYALRGMGKIAEHRHDSARACSDFEESLALFRALDNTWATAWTLVDLGLANVLHGDVRRAKLCYEESLALYRKQGDKQGVAQTLGRLGSLALDQDDNARARALFEESLILYQELGITGGIANSLNMLGELARKQGEYAQAATLYKESLILQRELGQPGSIAMSLHNLGYVAQHHNDYERGEALFVESLGLYRKIGDKNGIILCIAGIAGLAGAQGQPERAACLFGATQMLLDGSNTHIDSIDRNEYERNFTTAHAQLDEATFAAAWAAGRNLSLEQAIAYALEEHASNTRV
jgi:predicted ATPase